MDSDLGPNKDNWIFVRSLISMPATYLQRYFDEIGIYGLILGMTIILATSSIFSLILFIPTVFMRINLLIIYTIIVIIFSGPALIAPTYTGAAIFAGSSGFGLLFFYLVGNQQNRIEIPILGSILISLSYLIRAESFFLTFGFFFTLILFHLVTYRKINTKFKSLILPFSIFVTIFTINLLLDTYNYKDKAWQEYTELNDLRHSIQLRTAEYYLAENLDQISWSSEEFQLFRKFSLFDERVLNSNALEEMIQATDQTRGPTALLNSKLVNELRFINFSYGSLYWILTILVFFVFALIGATTTRSLNFAWSVMAILLTSVAINYVFAVSYHLPTRLTFNLLFLVTISVLVVSVFELTNVDKISKFNKLISFFLTTLLAFSSYMIFPKEINAMLAVNQENITLRTNQQKSIQALKTLNPEVVLVGTGSRILYHYQNPYLRYKNMEKDNQIIISGWHNLSPNSKIKIKSLGYSEKYFQKAVVFEPNIYWVDDTNAAELLKNYFQQQTGNSIEVRDLGYLGDPFYRVFDISEAG